MNLNKFREVQPVTYVEPPAIRRGDPDQPSPDSLRSGSSSSSQELSSMRFNREKFMNATDPTDGEIPSSMIPPDQLSDEDFDMKGTSRKEYENEYFKRICSEVIDGFLYLGSDFIA